MRTNRSQNRVQCEDTCLRTGFSVRTIGLRTGFSVRTHLSQNRVQCEDTSDSEQGQVTGEFPYYLTGLQHPKKASSPYSYK